MNLKEAMSLSADATDTLLTSLLTKSQNLNHSKLWESMLYSVKAGGKRIRPYLANEFCVLCGSKSEKSLWYAASVEMLHTMSLIHDDLPAMDNDCLRRGRPTNHVVYGEATAILAGDALLSESFLTASKNPLCSAEQNLEAVKALAVYGGADGMMGGQQTDLLSENTTVSQSVLEDLVTRKTGALLACSCLLGCIAADAGEEKKKKATEFGYALGMAFQITDDILDFESDEATLGKSIGKDASAGKSTFVTVYGLQEAKDKAFFFTQKAKESLAFFDKNESRDRLFDLCEFILNRKY